MKNLKMQLLKKLIVITIVILLPLQTTLALAENEVPPVVTDHTYISIDMARNITANYDFCKQKNVFYEKQITLLDNKNVNLMSLSDEYKNKIMLIESDKEIYKVRGDKFQTEYEVCADGLNKCEAKRPSKLVWFGIGFVVASILGTVVVVIAN